MLAFLRVLLPLTVLVIASKPAVAGCLTTLPSNPPFVPPTPYQANTGNGFWYGTEALWTHLPLQKNWTGAGVGQKFFVWSQGFDWRTAAHPFLIVTGKRLDGEAPPIAISGGTTALLGAERAAAMLIGVSFPTEGCWELSAYHDNHVLTFVVSIGP
jgi:hypothetical protein